MIIGICDIIDFLASQIDFVDRKYLFQIEVLSIFNKVVI